jgi:hypothetical protein
MKTLSIENIPWKLQIWLFIHKNFVTLILMTSNAKKNMRMGGNLGTNDEWVPTSSENERLSQLILLFID